LDCHHADGKRLLLLVSDFHGCTLSPDFVMAFERQEAELSCPIGVLREDYYALISLIERKPPVKPSAQMACCLQDDLDDTHHPFVLVINRMAVVDKAPKDHRVGKWDDHLQHARPVIPRRQN
jgi:hypothetical protein